MAVNPPKKRYESYICFFTKAIFQMDSYTPDAYVSKIRRFGAFIAFTMSAFAVLEVRICRKFTLKSEFRSFQSLKFTALI